jgi:putative ABC transport system ATP-binding protein
MLALHLSGCAVSYPGLASPVLQIDNLKIAAGDRIAITGASGSGKSTFVNIVTGLEATRQGKVDWSGRDIATLSETARDRWRGENVGLVMQDFHLLPGLSAMDNILLPARLARAMSAQSVERADFLLKKVGLSRPEQRVETMSRGEMQRVAIARALLRKPGVVVADEPTASLDPENAESVGRLLVDLARIEHTTLIVITHDRLLADRLSRRIELSNGRIASDVAGKTAS